MLAYVVWSSLFAVPPLLALSLLVRGPGGDRAGAGGRRRRGTWAAVLWQSLGNTLFGYAAWGWLLARYPAATVSPMALLVPVFGMGASALLAGRGAAGVEARRRGAGDGRLALNMLWPRRVGWRA